jgi:hypothetical protein
MGIMLRTKRLGMLAGFIASLLGSSPGAVACLCSPPIFHEALQSATAIFSGKVVAIDSVSGVEEGQERTNERITFEVYRQWKGDVGTTEFVTTSLSSNTCGYDFMIGTTYLVYANEFEGLRYLHTGDCYGNKEIGSARDDLAGLGEGKRPVDNARVFLNYALAGVAVIALLGGAIMFRRSRRRT